MRRVPPARPRPMGLDVPVGNDPAAIRQRVEMVERVLERGFRVPGVNLPFGLDAVLGLVPVVGDVISAGLGAYIVWEARNLGLPKWKLLRMAGNVAFDTTIGAIPIVGDAFDLVFRSNTRNLKVLKRHLDKHHPASKVIEG
nr:DUF4112 domain-containing protein [Altericroceibacterium xinjiangense]